MTANKTTPTQQDALAAIRRQKADIRKRIRTSAETIRATTHDLFAPPVATNKTERFMNLIEQGIAMYEGVMLGMRVLRNVRSLFGRKRA